MLDMSGTCAACRPQSRRGLKQPTLFFKLETISYDLSIRKAPSTLHPSIRLLDSRFISRCSAVVLVSVVMWQVSPHAVSNRSNSRLSTCSSSVAKSVAGALTDSH